MGSRGALNPLHRRCRRRCCCSRCSAARWWRCRRRPWPLLCRCRSCRRLRQWPQPLLLPLHQQTPMPHRSYDCRPLLLAPLLAAAGPAAAAPSIGGWWLGVCEKLVLVQGSVCVVGLAGSWQASNRDVDRIADALDPSCALDHKCRSKQQQEQRLLKGQASTPRQPRPVDGLQGIEKLFFFHFISSYQDSKAAASSIQKP